MIILDFISIFYKLYYFYLLLRSLLFLFRFKYKIKYIFILTFKNNYRNIKEITFINEKKLIIIKRNNI